jgi:drug/metabolite transporter (DMT)-like permease
LIAETAVDIMEAILNHPDQKMPPTEFSSSRFAPSTVLLGISIFWATSFAIIKDALIDTSPANFVFIRFFIACLILLPFAWSRRRYWTNQFIKPGIWIGFFLFGAFFTQAWGLVYTSASRSGFITGLNVILVPLFTILIFRRLPKWFLLLGSVLALSGLYLLTSSDAVQGLPFNIGDILTIICAMLWAGHILVIGRYSPEGDAFWLTFLQVAVACLGSLIWVIVTGEMVIALPGKVYGAALYLAFACTVLGYWGQTWAQSRTSPIQTAIIFSMEPVFAALFAWFWLGEKLGLWGWVGAGLILSGMMLAELKSIQSWGSFQKISLRGERR